MFKQRKHYNKSPMRRKIPGVGAETLRGRRTEILPTLVGIVGNVVTVTFDQAVIVSMPSGVLDDDGNTPLSFTQPAPNQVAWTFAATPQDTIEFPFEEPSVRNTAGGYVRPGVYTEPGP